MLGGRELGGEREGGWRGGDGAREKPTRKNVGKEKRARVRVGRTRGGTG